MKQIRFASLALAGIIGLSVLAPTAAHASREGRRNTALALGAVAVYGLVRRQPLIAGLAGAGALYTFFGSGHHGHRRHRRYCGPRDYGYYDRGGYGYRRASYGDYYGRGYYDRGYYDRGYYGGGYRHYRRARDCDYGYGGYHRRRRCY